MEHAHPLQVRTLAARTTLEWRGCDQLKLENPDGTRWWLCTHHGYSDHRITIESYNPSDGTYETTDTYPDKEAT